MELIVIGAIYVVAFAVFAVIVLKGHDPGPFATYSAAALTALLPFLRGRKKNDSNDSNEEEESP